VIEPETPLDAERILRTLAEHHVDYILIGGLAVQTHGHVRTTNDADLIPAPDRANLERLASALRLPEAQALVDVHEVPRGRSYEELSKGALHVQLGDIDVPVVGLDDLIQMKLARGRPVDLADVASLTDPDATDNSDAT
jgi:predicted nucleotidyltransferase